MSVKFELNLGTIMAILGLLVPYTVAGVWWAGQISSDLNAMRAWQVRQDDRLVALEATQDAIRAQGAATQALLEVLRDEMHENREVILDEVRNGQE